MSPADIGWVQGSVFFILGLLAPRVWHRVRKFLTQHKTSDEELHSIHVQNDTSTDPVEGEQPFEQHSDLRDDNEGRSPSNHDPEAMVSTALPRRPDPRRFRSNGRTLELPESVTSRRFMAPEITLMASEVRLPESVTSRRFMAPEVRFMANEVR